jgi:3-deoxy-D-manno-octulosonate 8-phosphate phosphatase (KDO 8-P phosphatase)
MASIPVEHAAIEHLPLTQRASRDSMLMTRAGNIRLACFDVDGTLTDGRLFFDSEGRELKAFHVHDGQGLVLLRQVGIEVALITARHSEVARRRAEELGVRAHIGVKDKLACVRELCAELGIGLDAVCFMGDDLPDLPAMRAVGLSVAPANAHAFTASQAELRTHAGAGAGAARELCDLLIAAQGSFDDPMPVTPTGELS